MKKSEKLSVKKPPLERYWFRCPYCGKKLALYDNTTQCNGVFLKCKNCKNEVELKV